MKSSSRWSRRALGYNNTQPSASYLEDTDAERTRAPSTISVLEHIPHSTADPFVGSHFSHYFEYSNLPLCNAINETIVVSGIDPGHEVNVSIWCNAARSPVVLCTDNTEPGAGAECLDNGKRNTPPPPPPPLRAGFPCGYNPLAPRSSHFTYSCSFRNFNARDVNAWSACVAVPWMNRDPWPVGPTASTMTHHGVRSP